MRQCSSFHCDDDEKDELRKRRGQPVPCLAKGAAMLGLLMLLLLGLLARAPLLVCAQSPSPVFMLTELCHYTLNIDYIEQHLSNFSMKMLPPEGKQSVLIYCPVVG